MKSSKPSKCKPSNITIKKTICLNMIVKNEAHIIKETLNCVFK